MRNKFPGTCYRCGKHVAAKEGHFERVTQTQVKRWNAPRYVLGTWLIQHASCAIKFRGTNTHHIYEPISAETCDAHNN